MTQDFRIRLLIVDDEQTIRRLCITVGESLGLFCLEAESGDAALALLEEQPVHMVLTDMVMPRMSGIEFLEQVKRSYPRIEVAVMTGHGSVETAVQAMKLGAYDYITKPFSPREVILRIKAILRRGDGKEAEERLTAGAITIDPARHQVSVNGKPVSLTSLEFKLLRTLMQRRGRVQQRDRLLNEVWGYESVIDTRTVDTHVRRLREKLGKAGDIVETVRGFGYRLREK